MAADREKRITEIQFRLNQLEDEKRSLLEELQQIRSTSAAQVEYGVPASSSIPNSADKRVRLFTRLFRSRADVFPKLWESAAKGMKGYSPACRNEWVRPLCAKPKIKCSLCSNREFIPLDESIIRDHLEGKITVGTYAIREDDTCIFLAADFDEGQSTLDVLTYQNAGQELGIPIAVERSRSGKGAHAWIFFREPIPARIARQLGTIVMTQAIARNDNFNLNSYDRFFPSQDTLPKGGFGNLIALPLQRIPRNNGNSVFVDEHFTPYEDQWQFLSRIHLLSLNEVLSILEKSSISKSLAAAELPIEQELKVAEKCIDIRADTFPKLNGERVSIHQSSRLEIEMAGLPARLMAEIKRLATFANPKFFEAQRMRFSTWNIPRYICCAEKKGSRISIPRGLLDDVKELLIKAGAQPEIIDRRKKCFSSFEVVFEGKLLEGQQKAFEALLWNESGVLVAPPGAGKTVIACALIAERKTPTLIIVHRKQLMEQWKSQLHKFLGIEKKSIGTFSISPDKRSFFIDIGMIQTVAHAAKDSEILEDYGQIIIDECHHIPAVSFESTLNKLSALFHVGLTATPYRKDGLQAIIHMQCGPIRYTMEEPEQQSEIIKRVIVKETTFAMAGDSSAQTPIHEVWDNLTKDVARLRLIVDDVVRALEQNRFPLILSDRRDHLDLLAAELKKNLARTGYEGFLLTSDAGKKERKRILTQIADMLKRGEHPYLLSTGALIGEGFDLPELSTLMLAMPVAFKGRIVQYAGRIHRVSPGKTEVEIYDYVDSNIGLGISMFKKRLTAYRKMGYSIEVNEKSKLCKMVNSRRKKKSSAANN